MTDEPIETCARCRGDGLLSGPRICPSCLGEGRVAVEDVPPRRGPVKVIAGLPPRMGGFRERA